jgi:hypothetical protein
MLSCHCRQCDVMPHVVSEYAVTDHVAQSRTVHTGLAVITGTEDRQHVDTEERGSRTFCEEFAPCAAAAAR